MKIAFTGPESSGKSSISKAVAEHFQAQWFEEYAREYLLERNGEYDFEDIEKIGLEQENRRNVNLSNAINIYDTEALVLYVWSIFKYNRCSEGVLDLVNNQQFDHYFLCNPEGVPWEDDPLREHPNQREELFEIYLEELRNRNLPFTILKGSLEEKVKLAIGIVEGMKKITV